MPDLNDQPQPGPRWHQALAWALTGRSAAELGHQAQPDLGQLIGDLRLDQPAQLEALRQAIMATRSAGRPWPHPVPDGLMIGLGAAQFTAALSDLRRRLAPDSALDRAQRPVARARALDATERRLLEDVPPHHGV